MPPTRRLNIATEMMKAKATGTAITRRSVSGREWNGCQNQGSDVIWFQSMKSGMPGVDWIFVFSTLEASSFKYIAMQ